MYTEPIIFHIDVNSAFLSWSALEHLKENPQEDYRLIPSIVGGDQESRHGVVLAKSVPAKKYQIQTGEPVVNALRKCPSLLIIPPQMPKYREYSRRLMEYLHSITPDIQQLSIDECFLDFTPIQANYSSALDAANQIREYIHKTFGFTVNIGIAPNKLLAKMASDFTKPDRVHTLYLSEIPRKMWPLPVNELYMVGKSSVARLNSLGIHTIGELAKTDLSFLTTHFKSHGKMMWEYANGIHEEKVISQAEPLKGIGNSITLPADLLSKEAACQTLLSLSDTVSKRLRKEGRKASTVCVELKYSDFTSHSKQTTTFSPISQSRQLYEISIQLFDQLWNGSPIRLVGIRTTNLQEETAPAQMSLFDYSPESSKTSKNQKQLQLDQALDQIKQRFGEEAILRGSELLKS